jgi:exonuclease VII small subunit
MSTGSSDDALQRAESLLQRLERTRQELEQTQDPDRAIEILSELSEIAKEVETELQRAKDSAP